MISHLFAKHPIPEALPAELRDFVVSLSDIDDKSILIEKIFRYTTSRWGGWRLGILTRIHRIYYRDLGKMIHARGYLHCTNMNYIMRSLLIHTGRFEEGDIEPRLTHTWYIGIHQYLRIRIGEREYIDIDPWSYQYGIPFGRYGKGFDSLRIFPKAK